MLVPNEIRGRKLTPEEKHKFIKNELTYKLVMERTAKGMSWDDAFEPRRDTSGRYIKGNLVTDEIEDMIYENNLTRRLIYKRMRMGMTFEEAVSIPKGQRRKRHTVTPKPPSVNDFKMPLEEVEKVIGRIKYINRKKLFDGEQIIPLGILRRAKEYNIDIEAVKEVKV